jgi:regulator of protease activity HflC (stomatin/prohibitin superfamily)
MTELILVAVGLAIVLGVAALILFETAIVIDPGTVALVLRRGRATERALTPGRHFVEPWRKVMVQVYPSRELTFVAGGPSVDDPRVEFADEPLRVHLGDRALATVSYTVRCQLDPAKLKDVHERYGPDGIWPAVRDATRQALLTEVGTSDLTIEDVYGEGFVALEQRLTASLERTLGAVGFELRMFSLREIDLGETGEIVQAVVRSDVELEREQARTKVRRARIENDAAIAPLLDDVDGDTLIRYRQIEAWSDILHRWDGDRPIPSALTMPLLSDPVARSSRTLDNEHAAPDETAEPTAEPS